MADYHVILRGHAPGASGLSLPNETREFVIHDVDSPGEAERAALRAVSVSGVEGAVVVAVVPWTGGELRAPHGIIVP